MGVLEAFLSGEIDVTEFFAAYEKSKVLRKQINGLIPKEAIGNPSHSLWKRTSYETMAKNRFKITRYLDSILRFDGSFGDDLNLHGTIANIYRYQNPDFSFTTKYKDASNLVLTLCGDYYGGVEVDEQIDKIVREIINVAPKSKRIKEGKNKMAKLFHTVDGKKPYWIQSPDWPMGKKNPMKYVRRRNRGEAVDYYFVDADTGEKRIVTQYY